MVLSAIPLDPEFSVSSFENRHNNSVDVFVPKNVNPHQFPDENGLHLKVFVPFILFSNFQGGNPIIKEIYC